MNLYVDLADPGVSGTEGDSITSSVSWGDGQVDVVAVPAGQLGFAAQHTCADKPLAPIGAIGRYQITVKATDDDGGSSSASMPMGGDVRRGAVSVYSDVN